MGLDLDPITRTVETTANITPAWEMEKKTKKEKIEWFIDTRDTLERISQGRILRMINNIFWYTGEADKISEYSVRQPGSSSAGKKAQAHTIPRVANQLYDITEQRTSRVSRYKPNCEVVPTKKSESNPLKMARMMRNALDHYKRRIKLDGLVQNFERWNAVCGEVYIANEWNPRIGDKVDSKKQERVGDVDTYLKPAWTVFLDHTEKYEDCLWSIDIWKICNYKLARKLMDKTTIEPDKDINIFSWLTSGLFTKRQDEVIIYRVIQKPTEFTDGFIWYICNNKIVKEETPYPYSHDDFPWVRYTDIEVPGRLYAMSFFSQLIPLQHIYNKLLSLIVRNISLASHPKFMIPEGSGVSKEKMGNAPSVIRYTPSLNGAKPEILTFSSVPSELFEMLERVRAELERLSGIFGVSRGDPPSGTRAKSMLTFYEEQEEQRASTWIIKHNEMVRQIYYQAASIMGDYYPTGDRDRMIRVLGKDGEYSIDAWNNVKISSEYEVVIQNSTGFSESMSGRLEQIQAIMQIEGQRGIQLLTPQQVVDVLELKDPQKAYDIATASLKNAEEIVEALQEGSKVATPKKYWDLLTVWKQISIAMNAPRWQTFPDEKKQKGEQYLLMVETLIHEKQVENPQFAQKVVAFAPDFPLVFHPEPQPQEKDLQQKPEAKGAIPVPPEAMMEGGAGGQNPQAPAGQPQNGPAQQGGRLR